MKRRVPFFCTMTLASLLTVSLTGCMIAQIPSRTPVEGKKKMDFIQVGKTSRSDVRIGLAREDEYYDDLRVGCYLRNIVRYKKWLFVLIFPMESRPGQIPSSDVAFIQFDEHERVQRVVKARAVWRDHWRSRAEKTAGVNRTP